MANAVDSPICKWTLHSSIWFTRTILPPDQKTRRLELLYDPSGTYADSGTQVTSISASAELVIEGSAYATTAGAQGQAEL